MQNAESDNIVEEISPAVTIDVQPEIINKEANDDELEDSFFDEEHSDGE